MEPREHCRSQRWNDNAEMQARWQGDRFNRRFLIENQWEIVTELMSKFSD